MLIKWTDNHQSTYSYEWLRNRSFSKQAQEYYMENIYQPKRILWDKGEFKDIFHFYDYQEIATKYVVMQIETSNKNNYCFKKRKIS